MCVLNGDYIRNWISYCLISQTFVVHKHLQWLMVALSKKISLCQ